MARYTGRIKLVILDIAGTVCDGPQDLSHLYPNDDGLAVKGPVIVFDKMFQEFGLDVDWETIRRPMGKFKREHLADIMAFDEVARQYRKVHGRECTEDDLDEMFDMFRPTMAKVAVTEDLIRPFDGVKEAIDALQAEGIQVGCDTGYPVETCNAIYGTLEEKFGIRFDVVADSENVRGRSAAVRRRSWFTTACTRPTSFRPPPLSRQTTSLPASRKAPTPAPGRWGYARPAPMIERR
ncbi:MAG: HAD family hydrolase [Planctomycetota bacterium]